MQLRVDAGSLHATAQDFKSVAREVENTINQLDQAARHTSWSGSSHSSFSSLWGRLHQSLTELNSALQQIGQRVDQAGTVYAEADKRAVSK